MAPHGLLVDHLFFPSTKHLSGLLGAAAAYRPVPGFRAWAAAAAEVFLREILGDGASHLIPSASPESYHAAAMSLK